MTFGMSSGRSPNGALRVSICANRTDQTLGKGVQPAQLLHGTASRWLWSWSGRPS